MASPKQKKLPLSDLGLRHPGVTKAYGDSLTEAAAVCLNRHHISPITLFADIHGDQSECVTEWLAPDAQMLRTYANDIDATEAGAYGVSLAAIEALEGLVAVRRAETLTGADFYVAPTGTDPDDLESCLRLEVSGVSSGGKAIVEARLKAKLKQTEAGKSNLPAIASVIGFKERLIAIAKMHEKS